MCGIAGFIHLNGEPIDHDVLLRMTRIQAHRGPDDEGTYVNQGEHIGVGHRRLSIIDLSSAGHQPMCFMDRYWIIYNGEAYNYIELRGELEQKDYQFSSKTDTEVILAAYACWGTGCLNHLNGMWAFTIWDAKDQILFCARDRFGVKPFYYYWDKKRFVFATEIKAIIEYLRLTEIVPIEPNNEIVADYLLGIRLDSDEETFFHNIWRLPPSHYLILRNGTLQKIRYYTLDPDRQLEDAKPNDCFNQFFELFSDSVCLRLRSDVPVGSCLSGGLDSSSIVCTVNHLLFSNTSKRTETVRHQQKTFSACYEEYPEYDERDFIKAVLDQTGAEGHYTFPSGREMFEELEKFIWHQDEPVGSTSQYAQWCVFRLAHDHGMKVMLDGQGADETITGYHGAYHTYFLDLALQRRWRKIIHEISLYQKHHQYPVLTSWVTLARGLIRVMLPQIFYQEITNLRIRNRYHPFFTVRASLKGVNDDIPLGWKRRGALQEYLFRMTTGSSLQSLLRYEDRNSMAFSIEARIPFLDYRLVEFVFSLPPDLKVNEGLTKVLLREAMKGVIPEKIRNRKDKIGFATPEGQWFKTVGQERLRDIFASRSFVERGYFNANVILRAFDQFCTKVNDFPSSTYSDFWKFVNPFWRALSVELWFHVYMEGSNESLYSCT